MEPKPYVITKDRSGLAAIDMGLLFVDTTGDDELRAGVDLDLSHWYPNRTPRRYRADTSAAIALRFAAEHPDHAYTVLNDHADTDGVVSVFALVFPELAIAHSDVLAEVAGMGDFSFWAERPARLLYAALSERRGSLRADGVDTSATFDSCLSFLAGYLRGEESASPRWVAASDAFERSAALVQQGDAARTDLAPRLVEYRVGDAFGAVHLSL